jgi:hypothetical protein
MPITITWTDSQKTAYLWCFEGRWTWAEYNDAVALGNKMGDEVSHKIDVIVDLRKSGLLPNNVLSNARVDKASDPEKLGRIALLGANLFVRRIADALGKIHKPFENKFFSVNSYDEAVQRLAAYREANSVHS